MADKVKDEVACSKCGETASGSGADKVIERHMAEKHKAAVKKAGK